MAKKASAADRTIDMFSGKTAAETVAAAIEQVETEERPEFEPMEARADGYRDRAFQVQEWSTSLWGKPTGENQYRVTRKGDTFYLEELKTRGGSYYGYAGLMLVGKDFINAVKVLAEAAREYNRENKK